mmetsp:Transcript_124717/g.334792  ORF Transcript_124717/g.334792 Transcript_124717/m.334792 type:complete len:281 (+) Transcript_124717:656-1498(+)
MEPLREQPPVEGHLAPVAGRDLLEARQQRGRQVPRRRHRVRRHGRHEFCQPFGFRLGRGHVHLKLVHEVLALVPTAQGVHVGGLEAVRAGHEVVGHDHHRVALLGLVQGAEGAQVGGLLVELPVAVQRLAIEVRQAHPPSLVHLELLHLALQRPALPVVEGVVPLPDLRGQPLCAGEIQPALQLPGAGDATDDAQQPLVGLAPASVLRLEDADLRLCLLGSAGREVASPQEAHEERHDQLLGVLLREVAEGGELKHLIGRAHPLDRLDGDEVLDCGREEG